jgi:hypothetical protein
MWALIRSLAAISVVVSALILSSLVLVQAF